MRTSSLKSEEEFRRIVDPLKRPNPSIGISNFPKNNDEICLLASSSHREKIVTILTLSLSFSPVDEKGNKGICQTGPAPIFGIAIHKLGNIRSRH